MEDPQHWVGWLAGITDHIVDDEGPASLFRTMFCFPSAGGCCSLGKQEPGARFEGFQECAVECHTAECSQGPKIIAQMMQVRVQSSRNIRMRALIDDLSRAIAARMREKFGLEAAEP